MKYERCLTSLGCKKIRAYEYSCPEFMLKQFNPGASAPQKGKEIMENGWTKELARLKHELAFERARNDAIISWLKIQVERMRLEGGQDKKT